jgi:hypothetical protein
MNTCLFGDPALDEKFRRDGYVTVPFLNPTEVQSLQKELDELQSGCSGGFYTSLWSEDVEYRRRVYEMIRKATEAKARDLLGDYVLCLGNFAVKQPNAEDSSCPLHQDWTFVDEKKHTTVSFWIPLVDVDATNGCLAVIPHSHRTTERRRPNYKLSENYLPFTPVLPLLRERYLIDVPISAGTAIAYHPGLLHASKPNRSPRVRAAAVAVYVPADADLLHFYQPSDESIDVYKVDPDFYWKSVTLGAPPSADLRIATEDGTVEWMDEQRIRQVCVEAAH